MNRLVIASIRQNQDFSRRVAHMARTNLEPLIIKNFSDGEIWCQFPKSIRGADVFLIASTNPPADNKEELLISMDAARRAAAKRITAVQPYMGGLRQDRKDKARTPITAKKNANELEKGGASRIIIMDPHFDQIQGFFDIPVDVIYASKVFIPLLRKLRIPKLTVVATDAGDVARATKYASWLGADVAFVIKKRTKHNEVEILGHVGNVDGRNILVVDDIIDTAGTFVKGIDYLHQQGAKNIFGAATHAICSGEALTRLRRCKHLTKLWVTDTLALPPAYPNNIEVVSVAGIFAQAIVAAHRERSINHLFLETRVSS